MVIAETVGLQRGFLLPRLGHDGDDDDADADDPTKRNKNKSSTDVVDDLGVAGKKKKASSSGIMKSGFLLREKPSTRTSTTATTTTTTTTTTSTKINQSQTSPTKKSGSSKGGGGGSSGFTKGFLVSKTTRRRPTKKSTPVKVPVPVPVLVPRRQVEASQDLLSFEEEEGSLGASSGGAAPLIQQSATTSTTSSLSSPLSFWVVDNDADPNHNDDADEDVKNDIRSSRKHSKPLISVIDDEEGDGNPGDDDQEENPRHSKDLQEQRIPPLRPLISILGGKEEQERGIVRVYQEHSNNTSTVTGIQKPATTADFLFQEQSSTLYSTSTRQQRQRETRIIREPPNNNASTSTGVSTLTRATSPSSDPTFTIDTPLNHPHHPIHSSDLFPVIVAGESSGASNTSFLEFQQKLARMKWENKHHNTGDHDVKFLAAVAVENDNDVVVEKWTPMEVSWAWEWLFSLTTTTTTTTTTSKSRSFHHAGTAPLSQSLLHHHPSMFQRWLDASETPQDRTQALQLTIWIQDYLLLSQQAQNTHRRKSSPSNGVEIVVWREKVLPGILILAEQPRRTVLAQETWITCTLLVVWICKHDAGNGSKETSQLTTPIFLNLVDTLDRLLQTQLKWKQGKKKTSAKNQAQIRLLEDWIRFNHHCRKDPLILDWRKRVLGIPLDDNHDDDHFREWGGLYHLFCGEVLATRTRLFGAQHLSSVWKQLVKQPSLDPVDQGILVRGVLAHLSTTKQIESNTHDDTTTAKVLDILPHIQDLETCEMVLLILSFSWFESNGLPPDLRSHSVPGLPKSLEQLLDVVSNSKLESHHTDSINKSPLEPIFGLVAKGILDLPDGVKAIEALISRQGMGLCTIRIFFYILITFRISHSLPAEDNMSKQHLLCDYVQDKLIDGISTSCHVRNCLLVYDRAVLGDMSAGQLGRSMPKLLGLYEQCKKQQGFSSDIESSITSILTWNLESHAVRGALSSMVDGVVTFLTNTKHSEGGAAESSKDLVCSKFCDRWRCVLLKDAKLPDTGFADLLAAIARAISCHPSSVALLAFFGAIVGDDIPVNLSSIECTRFRVMLAVERLFKFFADKMDEMQNIEHEIFRKLSPLLILRRVPISYFIISKEEAKMRIPSEFHIVSMQVLDYLASMLEIGPSSDHKHAVPEERRLAAEVAGRAIGFGQGIQPDKQPASTSQVCSTFHCICAPTFRALIQESVHLGGQLESKSISLVRRARAALYAACHSIPSGLDGGEESGDDEYRNTASFAMYVLGLHLDDLEDEVSREVVQLQTGCIEFFAICLARTVSKETSTKRVGPMLDQSLSRALLDPLKQISDAIIRILKFGNPLPEDEWICATESYFLTDSTVVVKKVSLQAKACLWNSMILVAQRCNADDGSLTTFGNSVLPLIAEYGSEARSSSDEKLDHPLGSAAALQTAFTIITRSRSLDCLEGHDRPKTIFVRMLQDWALQAIRKKSLGIGNGALRMAALKLLLALVTMDTIEGDNNSSIPSCLGREQLREILSAVKELSDHDPDSDIRALSSQILSLSNIK